MKLSAAIARSAVLALVSAALAALIMLAAGSISYAVRAHMGKVAPQAGFEPNFFLRTMGLPVACVVFLVVLVGSVAKLRG